jgi:hypothetical protein
MVYYALAMRIDQFSREKRENAADKRSIDREAERVYGFKPSQRSNESIQRGIANRNEALERREHYSTMTILSRFLHRKKICPSKG